MHGEPWCEDFAERQVPLVTDNPIPCSLVAAAGGQNEAESWRKRGDLPAFFQHLEAVVEENVSDPILVITAVAEEGKRNGVRELVPLGEDRPLLGEVQIPPPLVWVHVSVLPPLCGENMLYHSHFLVIGLFDQKAIIFDHLDGLWYIRGNRACKDQLRESPHQSE